MNSELNFCFIDITNFTKIQENHPLTNLHFHRIYKFELLHKNFANEINESIRKIELRYLGK